MELLWLLAPEVVCQIWAQVNQTHLICPVSVLTVGIYNKLPFAICGGARSATWSAWALRVGIYQYESQIAITILGH